MPRVHSRTGVRIARLFSCAVSAAIVASSVRADCLTPVLCPGDGNGDRTVNFTDILTTLANFGGPGPAGDGDHNGIVNFNDVLSSLANFGLTCPALRLREPGTFNAPPASPVTASAHVLPGVALDDFVSRGIEDTGVYGFSGEFHHSEIDLSIPSRGLNVVLARRYRSRIDPGSALGPGWDYSWNIWVSAAADDLILHDGNGSADLYIRGPIHLRGGPPFVWEADEFFRQFTQEPDGSYTLTFSDGGVWRFLPLDGSPAQGRISASVDRNGNTITFEYDGLGRLLRVVDPLDSPMSPREVTLAYTPEGRLGSVTDWAGRSVVYQYYGTGDPNGSPGDLKSVTTPVVVPTPDFPIPPGHEYPLGKTTVYTYSVGFADPALNHNLLTITDPKGQTYLRNTYESGSSSAITDDTVLVQVVGAPTDRIMYHRIAVTPEASNNFATLRVIRNDRVGNVEEWFYNSCNRVVMIREFTGRANPGLVTTDTANRPTGQVRATDPAFFETRYTWNNDALPTLVLFSNGNSIENTYELALNPMAERRSRGNLRQTRRLPGPLGGDQSQIVELFTYDPSSNLCASHTDGRGNTTTYTYDPAGNRLQTVHRVSTAVENFQYNAFGQMTRHILPPNGSGFRREDAFTYYPPLDIMHGLQSSARVDDTGFGLTTTFEYDAVGNMTRIVDPLGNDDLFVFNQLNQVVLHRSRAVMLGSPPAPVRYETETFYDANNRAAHASVLNVNEEGIADAANPHLTTLQEFDVLNNVVRTCREKGSFNVPRNPPQLSCAGLPTTEFITGENEYDGNRNLSLTRNGQAVLGADPTNVVALAYDERDLLYREVRAPGSDDQSSVQCDYDGNGNLIRRLIGLESVPVRTVTTQFDGYDRAVLVTDPMGNQAFQDYDANGSVVHTEFQGELQDALIRAGIVRLSEASFTFDALDRLIGRAVSHFNPATQAPIGDGQSVTAWQWSGTSQIVRITDDNAHARDYQFDTANRLSLSTDAAGNTVAYAYDANSRIVSTTGTEQRSIGPPAQQFVVLYGYDALHRLQSATDSVGNQRPRSYDSRNTVVLDIDALGRESRSAYDGIDRPLRTVIDMNGTGASAADPADIVLSQSWDDSHRLVARSDDNGNQTSYIYDGLNRRIAEQRADGTSCTWSYDANDNRISLTDANGSTETATYDLLDRATNRTISVGPDVSAETTFRAYGYDGLGRLIRAQDDDSLVTRTWDSLDNVLSEVQNGRTVSYTWDGVGNQTSITYPSATLITRQYDALDRVSRIDEPPFLVATYGHAGPSRLERRDVFNGTSTQYTYDGVVGVPNAPGDFGFKRVGGSTHLKAASQVDVRTYAWDRQQSKTRRTDVRIGGAGLTHAYSYDAADRLASTLVTNSAAMTVRSTQYTLDGVGNRQQVVENSVPGAYLMSPAAPVPADRQVNQYTQTPLDSRTYDDNGNLRSASGGGVRQFTFNYFDELVSFGDSATGLSAVYRYDALGRRIAKVVAGPGAPGETQFVHACRDMCDDDDRDTYGNWGVIEEWDGANNLKAGYICSHGRPLVVNRGGLIRIYHDDDMGSTMALTDHLGNLAEFCEYGDYGAPSFFNSIGVPTSGSLAQNPFLFHGHYYDSESGLFHVGCRYLDPKAGRFISSDPGGAWADPSALGNALTYAANNPWTYVDPSGRSAEVFTRFGDIEGESTDDRDRYDIPSESLTHGPSERFGASAIPRVTAWGTGERVHLPIRITKVFDTATPGFSKALCTGKQAKEFILEFCSTDAKGADSAASLRWGNGVARPRDYCVQYRETDFSFISRLTEAEGIYYCTFESTPPTVSFRPPRIVPRPHVAGSQTAVVVGLAGEEIYTDKYGRIKVQFHWDRVGKNDDNSSCWVRVAQLNTGGSMIVPRVGWEVIVGFEHGDPDRPLIVGSVWDAGIGSDTSGKPGKSKPKPTLPPIVIAPVVPAAGGSLPVEEVTMTYSTFKTQYSPQAEKKGGKVEYEWKVEKGEK